MSEHTPPARCAFKIAEFCAAHRISRSKFYILKGKGLAPRVTDVDGAQIISVEDAAAWRRERAEEASAAAPVTKPAEQPLRDRDAEQPTARINT
jgi:hypothetical protein